MTIKETIWLVFILKIACDIGLSFLLPWLRKKHADAKSYKNRLLQDNVDLATMINKQKQEALNATN